VVDPLTKGIHTMRSTRRHHPEPKLLSIEKTAEFLDVSASTVRRLVSSRQLKASKIGGQIRISLIDLLAYIDQSQVF
jgi:excisionase family DNA binding protein